MNTRELLQGDAWLGHPLHPGLVSVPVGLWLAGSVMDLIASFSKSECAQAAADDAVMGGVVGAAASVVTGLAEYTRTDKDTPAQEDAFLHGALNVTAMALNVTSSGVRIARLTRRRPGGFIPKLLSLGAAGIVIYTGWLGGVLAYRHGVGVKMEEERPTEMVTEQPEQQRTQRRRREEIQASV